MRSKLILGMMIISLLPAKIISQDEVELTDWKIKGGIGLNANIHSDFNDKNGLVDCCTQFTGKGGLAPAFFLGAERSFGDWIFGKSSFWDVRASYNILSQDFSEKKFIGNHIEGNTIQKIITDNVFEPTVHTVYLENMIGFYPMEGLPISIKAGFYLGAAIKKENYRAEKIVSPSGLNFETGKDIRGEYDGELQQANSFYYGLTAAAAYDYKLSETFTFAPELKFYYGLNEVTKNSDWRIWSLGVNAVLVYSIPVHVEPPIPPLPPPTPELPMPFDALLAMDLQIKPLKKNNIVNNTLGFNFDVIKKYSLKSNSYVVYFKENTNEPIEYSANNIYRVAVNNDALSSVADLLDQNKAAKLSISVYITENEEASVAKSRVQKIEQLLAGKQIDASRYEIHSEPALKSVKNALVNEENRKAVFAITPQPEMFTYKLDESKLTYDKQYAVLESEIKADALPSVYALNALYGSEPLFATFEPHFEYEIPDNILQKAISTPQFIEFNANIKDAENKTAVDSEKLKIIAFAKDTISMCNKVYAIEGEIEVYLIGLFEFDEEIFSSINKKAVEIAKAAIENGKKVELVSMTDNIGDEAYNTRLSARRTNAAKKLLDVTGDTVSVQNIIGGKFDNSIPNGRVMNRSVFVIIK